jgi:hypothetical protein
MHMTHTFVSHLADRQSAPVEQSCLSGLPHRLSAAKQIPERHWGVSAPASVPASLVLQAFPLVSPHRLSVVSQTPERHARAATAGEQTPAGAGTA